MTDHNQKLEPTDFSTPGAAGMGGGSAAASSPGGERAVSGAASSTSVAANKWLLPAFAGLVVMVLVVVFWLPQRVSAPDPATLEVADQGATDVNPARNTSAAQASGPAISPWSDAQLAKQRKVAQDVLGLLLEEQSGLEEMQVQRWALAPFAAAQEFAVLGDQQYREKNFEAATETYQQGLDAMLAISASALDIFANQLAAGEQALLDEQAAQAITAMELALLLQPSSREAEQAMARALSLEQVLELRDGALAAHAEGQLELAQQLLQEASNIDPLHEGISAQLKAVERDITRREFNRQMTAGYKSMDSGDFASAETHFQKARRIIPDNGETDSALMQARTGHTRSRLETWQQRAINAEANEDWDKAKKAHAEVLKIDSTVAFAQAGAARSARRAEMDTQLRKVLAEPGRLSDDKLFQRSQALYQQALAVSDPGPRLKRQLLEIDEVLRLAVIPISVLLESDEATDVTVFKVAHLGAFRRQQLSLKPGTYTAIGVRVGFRDVRRQFTVAHGQQSPSVEIACTEAI